MSVPPPGGVGTSSSIGFAGKLSWAWACHGTMIAAEISSAGTNVFVNRRSFISISS